jgi:hypothetical protein
MRRINTTLSNENQAALAETLVNLRDLSRNAQGAAARADAALVSIARTADSVGVATAALSRDVSRLADRYDTVGAEATTTLRDASAAMRQVSGRRLAAVAARREPCSSTAMPKYASPASSCAAPPMRSAWRRASSAIRARPSSARAKRAWGRGEPMNRRRAGLGLTLGRPARRLQRIERAAGAPLLRPRDRADAPRARRLAARCDAAGGADHGRVVLRHPGDHLQPPRRASGPTTSSAAGPSRRTAASRPCSPPGSPSAAPFAARSRPAAACAAACCLRTHLVELYHDAVERPARRG